MAKAKKKTVKKSAKKAKKTTVKKASKSTHSTSRPMSDKQVLRALWSDVETLSGQIAELTALIKTQLGRPGDALPATGKATTEQMEMFPDSGSNGTATLTKEDVTQALQEVGAKFGMPKVKALLTKFKAKKVSDIPDEQFPLVVSACKDLGPAPAKKAASTPNLFD